MVRKKTRWVMLLLLMGMMVSGCQFDASQLIRPNEEVQDKLIRVEIVFTDDKTLVGYVKQLAIDPESKVYVGGSSANYLYDVEGNVVGVFNYQRVLYMNILPAEVEP
ncbi:MAG: hypothetical protein WAO57_10315 [Syntrophomonadaceae bacterium]|nr:hypothetical protein [Bacillota bacterium]NLP23268.1 hypothetical protein [Syntrophomonadaceae bacterium]